MGEIVCWEGRAEGKARAGKGKGRSFSRASMNDDNKIQNIERERKNFSRNVTNILEE
jgi:hypothetical protein